MSSNFPIDEASRGAVKGALDWTLEQIKDLVEKFQNRDLAFIQDKKIIDSVKKQINTGKWGYYERYIKSGELRIIIWMGLTLRDYAEAGKEDEIEELRESIRNRFKIWGLHVAQFAQSDLIPKILNIIVNNMKEYDESSVSKSIQEFLRNIEKQVFFVSDKDSVNIDSAVENINIKIKSNVPKIFVITCYGSVKKIGYKIIKQIKPKISEYSDEIITSPKTLSCFFLKK